MKLNSGLLGGAPRRAGDSGSLIHTCPIRPAQRARRHLTAANPLLGRVGRSARAQRGRGPSSRDASGLTLASLCEWGECVQEDGAVPLTEVIFSAGLIGRVGRVTKRPWRRDTKGSWPSTWPRRIGQAADRRPGGESSRSRPSRPVDPTRAPAMKARSGFDRDR